MEYCYSRARFLPSRTTPIGMIFVHEDKLAIEIIIDYIIYVINLYLYICDHLELDLRVPKSLTNKKIRLLISLILGIFLFICSLEGVKSGFKLIFAELQRNILGMVEANTDPVTGLALGILGTALVQSSSAVVAATMVSMSGMVASGLPLNAAIANN